MKECEVITKYKEVSPEELSAEDRELVETAKEMTRSSYAPWSKFMVGAAIRLEDGSIVKGANQENVAFPSGTCAERSACYWAGANHPGMKMRKIAIAARNLSGDNTPENFDDQFTPIPTAPCGACRQALLEYETLGGPIEVILYGRDKTFILPSVASTLPFCFSEF
ncbi:MAG: cytidine deaminase [Bacteroidales bacterium]|nr:cytidine deaminase [Bacteroidales bacterium]